MDWTAISIWMQVGLSLIILSFLYRDNPLYKFAEHLFVGLGTGYFIIQQYHSSFIQNLAEPLWAALTHPGAAESTSALVWDYLLILPGILGFMFFTKFHQRTSWMARWPMAIVIGTFAGLAIIGFAQGDLVEQIRANLIPLMKPGAWSAFTQSPSLGTFFEVIYNPVLIVGVLSSLVYFFFSKAHTGVTGGIATVGIWFLMMSFGASYGATVMTRISLFIERANFMVIDNPQPTWLLALAVVVFLVLWRRRLPAERSPNEPQ